MHFSLDFVYHAKRELVLLGFNPGTLASWDQPLLYLLTDERMNERMKEQMNKRMNELKNVDKQTNERMNEQVKKWTNKTNK